MAKKGHNSQDNANMVADAVLHSYYSHTFILSNIQTTCAYFYNSREVLHQKYNLLSIRFQMQ